MTRIAEKLLQFNADCIFTAADLENLFPGSRNARYARIKRALASGELVRISRGLYTLAPSFRTTPLNPYRIAQMIHGPSYVSMESALSFYGMIPEAVYAITCVSRKKTRHYHTPLGKFSFVRVPQLVLFEGVNRVDNGHGNIFFMASPLKALADYVYVRKKSWQGLTPLKESLRLDDEALAVLKTENFSALVTNYQNKRVQVFLSAIQRELQL